MPWWAWWGFGLIVGEAAGILLSRYAVKVTRKRTEQYLAEARWKATHER